MTNRPNPGAQAVPGGDEVMEYPAKTTGSS